MTIREFFWILYASAGIIGFIIMLVYKTSRKVF